MFSCGTAFRSHGAVAIGSIFEPIELRFEHFVKQPSREQFANAILAKHDNSALADDFRRDYCHVALVVFVFLDPDLARVDQIALMLDHGALSSCAR